ncbi:bifunctional phosphopantothenoylcysteine decarboxylase/phosphopantothenate synthase [Novosphingobium tardum]|uniref:Coenzyme A biosynthesis bifunctional protein CoaBC n=1 Tax=Novosphingobium tardum TaxID=1538021 RepID=A0ABV8RMH1_9SPHN
MTGPRILLIVGGGIAAYKACELVRLIRKGGGSVTCVLTHGGAQFVTPLTLAALSENIVHTSLWDLKNEVEMGHIQLSREADLVVVCPATADLLAKMAAGMADDLATTLLLATDKPVLAVPAMNVRMWLHPATFRSVATLRNDGVTVLEPDEGPMACGEYGPGRLPEPEAIWHVIQQMLGASGEDIDYSGAEDDHDLTEGDSEEPQPVQSGLSGLVSKGLAGLSGMMIPRSRLPVNLAEDDWVEDQGEPWPEPEPLPAPVPEQAPAEPNAAPLLARKGKGKAAPPTDPQAIAELMGSTTVDPDAGPSPGFALLGDDPAPPAAPDVPDLLDGQPDFVEEPAHRPLFGRHVLVTAGPTHEPIDPVRYIANRSSGKQGFAIAAAAAVAGARVTLVTGPVVLPTPPGVDRIDVETAREMAAAVENALPADAAVMVAAVADWRTVDTAAEKMKKRGSAPPALRLAENPDILATLGASRRRPRLLVGFAAETENVLENARDKLRRKGADWIVANDVSGDVMGGGENLVHIVSSAGIDSWENLPKEDVAARLVERIAQALDEIDGATVADD